MSKNLSVTMAQAGCVCKIANEKGVGRARFQQALNDGSFGRFLDSLKFESRVIAPPEGARIHCLTVKFDQGRKWRDSVKAAGPDTPDSYKIWNVGDQYPPVGNEIIEEELVLVSYLNDGGNWDRATEWAEAQNLEHTNPREVFAIGEHHQKLNECLGQVFTYVAATMPGFLNGKRFACSVRWERGRTVGAHDFEDLGRAGSWFAFRKWPSH